ncbi:MAG: helix-turn-helix transcriptional regulator [Clostridiales bacterium]|nr:helix-turn-helix transcriptional regulator [Clostridiales bacterium]
MNQDYMIIVDRLKQYRIDYPLTQSELAEKSGVSVRSISRFENGEDISMSRFISLMRALDLGDRLLEMIPDQSIRPSYYLESEKKRSRASGSRGNAQDVTFVWGEDK